MPVSHAPEMIPAERRARIVEALEAQRVVKVATLSDALGVSEITIRRDLDILEREGLLARSYGGAVLRKRSTDETGPEGAAPRAGRGEGAHRQGRRRHDRAA